MQEKCDPNEPFNNQFLWINLYVITFVILCETSYKKFIEKCDKLCNKKCIMYISSSYKSSNIITLLLELEFAEAK